ncbi:origin recognition complex subunit 4 [Cryptosporidium felis]|nr:origin recognition complex subunit 4 [Cryptosporidium felis]
MEKKFEGHLNDIRDYLLSTKEKININKHTSVRLQGNPSLPIELEKILDQIVIENTSRSCILIGKPCSGKTNLLASYFNKKKSEKLKNEFIIVHINCMNYDDNTLLSVLLERINEYFPMHRRLFSGHQKISILKEKLLGLSRCGYKVVFILENCEPIVIGTSNTSNINLNFTGFTTRQFALYTLVDVMHSHEINLVLILTTSIYDLSDFFEKRLKSRMSQRRILMEDICIVNKEDKIKYFLDEAINLFRIEKTTLNNSDECQLIDSYNKSIEHLFSYIKNKELGDILRSWEFCFEFEMVNELLSNIAFQLLLITPQSSFKDFSKVISNIYKKSTFRKNDFNPIPQGVKSHNCIRIKRFEELSILQHTILVAIIKLVTLGSKNITFKKIMNEINSLRNHISIKSNLSGLNLEHSEESYKMSFMMLVKMGIIEPTYYIKKKTLFNTLSTTPIKFTQLELYYSSLRTLKIPTILQYWLKNNIIR